MDPARRREDVRRFRTHKPEPEQNVSDHRDREGCSLQAYIRHPYRYHLRTSLEATVYGSIHHINERKENDMARERSPRLQQVSPFGLSNLLRKEHRFVVPRRACYSDAQKDSQKHCSEEDNCGGSCGICPTTSHRKPSSLGLIGRAETRGRQVENG